MTELQPGTRVRTAAVLSAQDWSLDQNKLRQAGVDGTIRAVHTPITGGDAPWHEPWYEVAHGPDTTAKYSGHELTPIRERAREAAAPTPEQDEIAKIRAGLEQERANICAALGPFYAGSGYAYKEVIGAIEQLRDNVETAAARLRWQPPIRERATEAAAPTPEQARLDKLAHDMADLRRRHESLERRYVGTLHRMTERLSRLQHPEPDAHPSEPGPSTDISAARAWCAMIDDSRAGIMEQLGTGPRGRKAAATLEAIPELLRRIEHGQEELRRRDDDWRHRCKGGAELYRGICQALQVDEDSMPIDGLVAAVKSKCRQVDRLAKDGEGLAVRYDELAQGIRDLTCARDDIAPEDALEAARWRMEEYGAAESALRGELQRPGASLGDLTTQLIGCHRRAIETLREVFDLRPGCDLITDAADDACEYPRELMRALGYDGVDGPLPQQCLRDVRAQRGQLEESQGRETERERIMADLINTLARHELGDVSLLEIAAARALEGNLHRELLRRLSPERLGLLCDWLEQAGDELGQSTLAELLHDLLTDEGPDSGEETRHVASCENLYCDGCAPPQSPR